MGQDSSVIRAEIEETSTFTGAKDAVTGVVPSGGTIKRGATEVRTTESGREQGEEMTATLQDRTQDQSTNVD